MKHSISRRDFLGSTTRAGVAWGLYPGAAWSKPPQHDAAGEGPLDRKNIEAEIRRRAEWRVAQNRLEVDYYRIRRRLAYPLPLKSLLMPTVPVATITDYPWATWLLWELEERVNALGWAAEWFGEEKFAIHAARDLEALSVWPKYYQMAEPSLESAHAGRILWAAWTKWHWLSEPLRGKIRTACGRHVQEVAPHAEAYFGSFASKQDLLRRPAPHEKLGNVAVIRTVGAALAAQVAADPAAARLNEKIRAIFGAILDLRTGGHAEGVGYDGYALDFITDWLTVAPADARREILEHPRFNDYLDESTLLGVPGAAEHVAELGDVEPREMPFHFSAQAKLASLQPHPVRAWLLRGWPAEWVRADALGALRPIADDLKPASAGSGRRECALRGGVAQRRGEGRPGRSDVVQQLAPGPHSERQWNARYRNAGALADLRPRLPAVCAGRRTRLYRGPGGAQLPRHQRRRPGPQAAAPVAVGEDGGRGARAD